MTSGSFVGWQNGIPIMYVASVTLRSPTSRNVFLRGRMSAPTLRAARNRRVRPNSLSRMISGRIVTGFSPMNLS